MQMYCNFLWSLNNNKKAPDSAANSLHHFDYFCINLPHFDKSLSTFGVVNIVSATLLIPPSFFSCPPTRLPARLSSSLAGWGALGGGGGPAGSLPASPAQRCSTGEAPSRGQPVHPGLPRAGRVEEGATGCSSPTQGLSAGSLLGQERQARSGQGAAPATGWGHQTELSEVKEVQEKKSDWILYACSMWL